jgi:hypothetical protein
MRLTDNVADIDRKIGEAVLQIYLDGMSYQGLLCHFCGKLFYRPKNLTAPQLCLVCRGGAA